MKYHFSGDLFEKKVAEINRNEPLIFLSASTFAVRGATLMLHRKNHAFIVDQFNLFETLLNGSGQFRVEGDNLLYEIDSMTFRITTAEEIFIVHEIFFERCYLVLAPKRYSVIDIGMNVGLASLFFANHPDVQRVYGYEPFRPTYQDAQANFELNPRLAPKIATHNFGLGVMAEKRVLNYSSDLKGKNSSHDEGSGSETIELKGAFDVFDEVIKDHPEENFFIKMDCEGAEFEIFENLKSQNIHYQIFGFIIEWHFKDPQPIIDVLLSNNFKIQLRGDAKIGLITAFR